MSDILRNLLSSTMDTSERRVKQIRSLWLDRLLDWKVGDPGRRIDVTRENI